MSIFITFVFCDKIKMNETIVVIIFIFTVVVIALGLAGGYYYWWKHSHQHSTGGGGHHHPDTFCSCVPSQRQPYKVSGWNEKIGKACSKGLTPECVQTQKIVCESAGGCFEKTAPGESPWCYKCGPDDIIVPPEIDVSCQCDDSQRKVYWHGVPKGSHSKASSKVYCLQNGGCWDGSPGSKIWCYYCD